MICFLYVTALSTCLGLAALCAEQLVPRDWSRRWIWCVAIALSILVPPIYRGAHVAALAGTTADSRPTIFARLNSIDVMEPWQIISLGLLVWGIATALYIARTVGSAARRPGGSNVVDAVPVVVTEKMGPATLGLWRSRVVLPKWVLAMPEEQRRYIVRHEDEHRRANDARMLLIASLALVVTPWNPALWWLLQRLSLAIEMDCDRRVIRGLGDAKAYGHVLLDVATSGHSTGHLQPAFIGGAGALEKRLRALLEPREMSRASRWMLPALVILLIALAFTTPHPVVRFANAAAPAHAQH